jgi:aspartate 1-decarboxylase
MQSAPLGMEMHRAAIAQVDLRHTGSVSCSAVVLAAAGIFSGEESAR